MFGGQKGGGESEKESRGREGGGEQKLQQHGQFSEARLVTPTGAKTASRWDGDHSNRPRVYGAIYALEPSIHHSVLSEF